MTPLLLLHLLGLLPPAPIPAADTTHICLAPADVETAIGNTAEAVNAVRETFTSYLTGPTLGVVPLTARLASQVREEARTKGCAYLLLPTLKHTRKSGGGGLLRRMAGGAVQQGAWSAGAAAGGAAGGAAGAVVGGAAAGAAAGAAYAYATSVKTKDEMTLSVRLESATGTALVEKTEKRKAESDGEDLLTPLVQHAAEAVAAAVAQHPR